MTTEMDALEIKRQAMEESPNGPSPSSSSSLASLSRGVEPLVTRELQPPKADGANNPTVQSMPYVKYRESVSAVFSFDAGATSRRVSGASTDTARSSPAEKGGDKLPVSYSVPSTTTITNTPRGRPAVDVIATYMNTTDRRTVKSELMRAHAHFASPHGAPLSRIRSSSMMSKDGSAEWGWFADIDSSSESWGGGDGSIQSLRRRLSADLGIIDVANAVHVLGDEQTNTRLTAAHKTFNIVGDDGNSRVVSSTISIPKFRIVQSRSGSDRHAQYLITFQLGKELYADWRRYSEFGELAKKLPTDGYPRTQEAWRGIDTRWFNRLEPSYLHQKCITLENFVRELMYESNDPSQLIDFLGGYLGKVNARPTDPVAFRPAAQLPKELRPPQPRHERELFEKVWEENFKRSRVNYGNMTPAEKV